MVVTLSENPENERGERGRRRGGRRCERPAACRGRQRRTRRGGARRRERPAAGAGARGAAASSVPHTLPGGFGNGPDSDDGLGGAQGARSSQSAPTELPGRIAALEEAQLQPQALVARPTRPGVAVAADGDGAAGRGARGRRGGEGSGGGVGRRARAPQRGRRVALPAPRQPLRGRRQSQTGVRGHGTGAPAVAPSTPADVFGTLMLPTGPLAASASSPAPAVTATGGVRGTCTGRWLQLPRAAGRPLPVPRAAARFSARTRASAADAFGAHAHARVPSQDDDDAYARSLCGGKPAWRGISASSLTSERQRHGRQLRQWCAHGRGRCQFAGRRWSCSSRRGCGGCKARRPKTIIRRRSECARPS